MVAQNKEAKTQYPDYSSGTLLYGPNKEVPPPNSLKYITTLCSRLFAGEVNKISPKQGVGLKSGCGRPPRN